MLVIKRRRMPIDTNIYIGTALVSLMAITAFVAIIHLIPLMKVDRFLAAKSTEPTESTHQTSDNKSKAVKDESMATIPEASSESVIKPAANVRLSRVDNTKSNTQSAPASPTQPSSAATDATNAATPAQSPAPEAPVSEDKKPNSILTLSPPPLLTLRL